MSRIPGVAKEGPTKSNSPVLKHVGRLKIGSNPLVIQAAQALGLSTEVPAYPFNTIYTPRWRRAGNPNMTAVPTRRQKRYSPPCIIVEKDLEALADELGMSVAVIQRHLEMFGYGSLEVRTVSDLNSWLVLLEQKTHELHAAKSWAFWLNARQKPRISESLRASILVVNDQLPNANRSGYIVQIFDSQGSVPRNILIGAAKRLAKKGGIPVQRFLDQNVDSEGAEAKAAAVLREAFIWLIDWERVAKLSESPDIYITATQIAGSHGWDRNVNLLEVQEYLCAAMLGARREQTGLASDPTFRGLILKAGLDPDMPELFPGK